MEDGSSILRQQPSIIENNNAKRFIKATVVYRSSMKKYTVIADLVLVDLRSVHYTFFIFRGGT